MHLLERVAGLGQELLPLRRAAGEDQSLHFLSGWHR
jgi:hypothetical protein